MEHLELRPLAHESKRLYRLQATFHLEDLLHICTLIFGLRKNETIKFKNRKMITAFQIMSSKQRLLALSE